MARRHVYDQMMEEDEMMYDYEEEAFSEEGRARWRENAERAKEGAKEVKEAFRKNYTKKQKILLVFHRIWRVINWLIITWLANRAFSKTLDLLQFSRVGRTKFIFLLVSIGFSAIMVWLGEGTDHDKFRTKGGQMIVIISEAIMLFPVIIMELINALTRNIGGEIFNVQNYENYILGRLWTLNLVLAVFVCISLLWEEQSTDKRLGFARTPQKKEITDFGRAKDEDGNEIWRFKKYKQ